MTGKSEENIFILKTRKSINPEVVWLSFVPESGNPVEFTAGQYITLYFLNSSFGWQGKSYSVASSPYESAGISIVVKKIGGFSSAIHELRVGDKVKIIGPTGYFYPSPSAKSLLFLAAGIGISPFYSILRSLERNGGLNDKNVVLLYSNKTKDDIVFFDELNEVAEKNKGLKIAHFLTRNVQSFDSPPARSEYPPRSLLLAVEGKSPGIDEFRRIDKEALKKYAAPLSKRECLICGSIAFVNDMWALLKEDGVPEENIVTEAFY